MRKTSKSTTARGYGSTHRAVRRRFEPLVASGKARCARCGEAIRPGEPWDLGHTDDRTSYSGPEHARCNRAAAGVASHRPAPKTPPFRGPNGEFWSRQWYDWSDHVPPSGGTA